MLHKKRDLKEPNSIYDGFVIHGKAEKLLEITHLLSETTKRHAHIITGIRKFLWDPISIFFRKTDRNSRRVEGSKR